MSQIDGKRGRCASYWATKVTIPQLKVPMPCWLWVVLFTVLLSPSAAYSAKPIPRSEEGNCRYDLTSIAALSCMQTDGVKRPPSHTCCKALVYAIDRVPVGNVSGACCLCRYMKQRRRPAGLASAYILCNGKDKRIVSKWSLFPIKKCSEVCTEGNNISSSVDMVGAHANEDIPVVHVHGTGSGNGVWIAVGVLIVMGIICFRYLRRFKAAANASKHRSESKAERRRSRKPKERRFSSS